MEESVLAIPTRRDNYVYLLTDLEQRHAIIVDPSDAAPVRQALQEYGLEPVAILVTHHHPDHVGGVVELQQAFDLPVYGYAEDQKRIPGLTHPLAEGDRFTPNNLDQEAQVWFVPGHTRGHIAYLFEERVFVGDTLFVAGCGRLFEGTAAQMENSLSRLASLPGSTRFYCGHEYTVKNLKFAATIEPENHAIQDKLAWAQERRKQGAPTVPSTLEEELTTNPFIRVREAPVQEAAVREGASARDPVAVFAKLRALRDRF